MAMGEVALVTTVPTDCAVPYSATYGPRGVRQTFVPHSVQAACSRSVGVGPVLDVYPLVLGCRLGPDPVDFPELTDSGEAMTHRPPNGDVVSVATAVVPAVGRPELTELCAAMQAIPVDADDVGRRIGRKRRSGQLADSLELFGWAPPRMWMRRPRQSGGSENSCAKRSA